MHLNACADPESFVRGVPTLTKFFFYFFFFIFFLFYFFLQLMRGSNYNDKWAIIGLRAKCHQMAFRWQANDGANESQTLNAGLVAFSGDPSQYC